MKCYIHPGLGSVATCDSCGRGVCVICAFETDDGVLCRPCAAKLLNLVTPAPTVKAEVKDIEKAVTDTAKVPSNASVMVGPEPNVEYPPSVCHMHPKVGSIAICESCKKGVCAACATEVEDKVMCRSCATTLRKRASQVHPVEVPARAPALEPIRMPSAAAISLATLVSAVEAANSGSKPKPTVKEAVKEPASAPSAVSSSVAATISVPSPATFSLASLASMTSPSPSGQPSSHASSHAAISIFSLASAFVSSLAASPAESDGSFKPIVPLILSVVVPGYGQIYNGQWKKGAVLLASYIIVWILIVSLLLQFLGGYYWLVLLIAAALILFGAYDAYATASKKRNGKATGDWFS